MRKIYLVAALAVTAALGCADGGGGIAAPDGPRADMITVRVTVSCPDTITVGQTAQCTALGFDLLNNITGSLASSWATSDSGKVSVTPGGVVGGVSPGNAQVSALMSGVIGSGTVVVVPEPD